MTTTTALPTSTSGIGPAHRALLAGGAVAGPLFVTVALAQAATRDGFDLRRHPFSMLSLGDLGWLQITNFVVAGGLFALAAIGIRAALRGTPGGTWGPIAYALFGLSQCAGGIFVADPALGFPVGAADGPSASISWHGTLHGLAFMAGMTSLIASVGLLARHFAATGHRRTARISLVAGAAFLLLGGTGAVAGDWRIVAVAVAIGWGWASLAAARIRRH